ncbi:MAG: hypothetical protein OXF79_04690 [Chloroflexi bacterium]|nr:hypothetical protein [Chloroflexota bacterium]
MTIQTTSDRATHHAIEAVKHLWMVPYTMMGAPDPSEGFAESITKDAQHAMLNRDNETFWYFGATTVAYSHIAANAVIHTLANHDNRDEVGELNADLIDEKLAEANHRVTMALADWFRAAEFHFKLGDVVHDVSTVNDHPSGFDCTRDTSQNVSWFHCANGDYDRQAPCLNCPAVQKLGTPTCSTNLEHAIDTILEISTGRRREPNMDQLGPMPPPESPVAHCRHAIGHLAEMARSLDTGSISHRGIAYAALAANDTMSEILYLSDYVKMDDNIELAADADRIAAGILSSESIDAEPRFTRPNEHDECIFRRQLTTGKTEYICAPPNAPDDWTDEDWGDDEPCRLCPMKSELPQTAMDRMLRLLNGPAEGV